jgi:hypothetical protein
VGSFTYAIAHTLILALVSYLTLQAAYAVKPRLPFDQPPERALGGAATFIWIALVMGGGQVLLIGLERFVYTSATRVLLCAAALATVSRAMDRLITWRAATGDSPS